MYQGRRDLPLYGRDPYLHEGTSAPQIASEAMTQKQLANGVDKQSRECKTC